MIGLAMTTLTNDIQWNDNWAMTLMNDVATIAPYNDNPGEHSPQRTTTGPKEQRPKRTTPNELTLVLRKTNDSVITSPLKGVAPR
jgi:hypothetical protein